MMSSSTWPKPASSRSSLHQFGLLAVGALSILSPMVKAWRLVDHAAPWQPDYILRATEQDADINCQTRRSVLLNGSIPGPPLHLQEERTTWIRVYNDMEDNNVTVHWHGLSQRTAYFADGTSWVTQWPIESGRYFDYEVRPSKGDAGTYFYHSHVGFQAVTATGPLIVHEAGRPGDYRRGNVLQTIGKGPYAYNGDIPLLFSDFFGHTDANMESGLEADPFVWSGETGALLINGQSGTAAFGNTSCTRSCKPHIIDVDPDKTYRLRAINGAALSFIMFGIEDHDNLTIIEADGQYTQPAQTNYIQFGSGQRYSVLLKTKTSAELQALDRWQFWVRVENRDRPNSVASYALLRYRKPVPVPAALPSTTPVPLPTDLAVYTKWMEGALHPLAGSEGEKDFPTNEEVTRTIVVRINQQVRDGEYSYTNGTLDGRLIWVMNNLSWTEDTLPEMHRAPYLVQAYLNLTTEPDYEAALKNGNLSWDPTSKVFPVKVGEVVDIVWQSNSGPTGGLDFHPFHAHGKHYWDLGAGNGTWEGEGKQYVQEHYADRKEIPVVRDTSMLYRYAAKTAPYTDMGWRAWRQRVTEDNVGVWLMHCHILAHMVMGMQTVWTFGDFDQIIQKVPLPYIEGYLYPDGSAVGNATYDPLVTEFL